MAPRRTILGRIAFMVGLPLGIMAPALVGYWWGDVKLLGAGLVVALGPAMVLFVVYWQAWLGQNGNANPTDPG